MPYGISQKQSDCSGWATVMETDNGYETIGCHQTKEDAIAQMVAISIAEDLEPIGDVDDRNGEMLMPYEEEDEVVDAEDILEVVDETGLSPRDSALYEAYEQIAEQFGMWSQEDAHYIAQSPFESEGMKCVNCSLFVGGRRCEVVEGDIAPEGICKLWVIRKELLNEDEPRSRVIENEVRQVDLSAPAFMRNNAKRGLKYHEEGLSGDGLKPQTVADARKMAAGTITEAKWRKIGPWIARHLVDLEAEGVAEGEVTAGMVAHLLWGSGTTKREATRAMNYANKIVERLDAERGATRTDDQKSATIDAVMDTEEIRTVGWVVRDDNESRRIAFSNIEVRAIEDDTTTLFGYAAVWDSPSEPLPWIEFVKRGAFTKTLNDGADVRLLIDHEGVPLARTRSGSLRLWEDDKGLAMETELDPTNPDAARLLSALRRGDISQMSFAFRTVKDSWNEQRTVRELREVQLFDVSVVTFPAYEATVAELRALNEVANIRSSEYLDLRRRQIEILKHR